MGKSVLNLPPTAVTGTALTDSLTASTGDPRICLSRTQLGIRPLLPPLPRTPTRIISGGTREFAAVGLQEAQGTVQYLIGSLLFIAHWDQDIRRWLD